MAEIDLIKISELPATSTIGDADELAVVQGGATKKVPYSALKAGAEVTPDTTLSEAGVPADAAAVGAALALKANQAAVTQALAAKADKTEVTDIGGDIAELASVVETKADQTALNQKADKTTTDALRQDLTTLNGIVNQKADKTELNTQIGNVTAELATKANTADVNNLLAAKANVASPVFTGRPQAPTAPKGTATLQLATTAFVQNAIDDKQDTLTFDAAPTENSTNPVTSGGVYMALEDAKDDTETAIAEVREESEEATAEAREIALKAFATPTASGQLLTLTDGADGIPAKTLTLNLSPHQSGSGDPSPDNVRPISGYDSVKVVRTGKNVLDTRSYYVNNPAPGMTVTAERDDSGNVVSVALNGTNDGTAAIGLQFSRRGSPNGTKLPVGDYIFSCGVTMPSECSLQVGRSDGGGTAGSFVSLATSYNDNMRFTNDIEAYLTVQFRIPVGVTLNNVTLHPMVRSVAFSDDSYEPYNAETYTLTIPTAAGIVYGGSLTVNDDGSGTLTVDMALVEYDGSADEVWTYSTNRFIGSVISDAVNVSSRGEVVSNKGKFAAVGTTAGTIFLFGGCVYYYAPTEITTVADFKDWLASSPMQVVYPLASPTTYTLTASQVTTLLGENTVWMDADGTIDLVYRADTQKYIDDRIALLNSNLAYIEDGQTASRAYSVGQYVLISGQLYKVTASIASGATFTVGTNVTATTVGTELTALN